MHLYLYRECTTRQYHVGSEAHQIPDWKQGKIGYAMVGIIYVLLLKTLQYILSQILQARFRYAWYVVVYR